MKQIKLFTLLVAVFCAANLNAQVDAPLTFEAIVSGAQVTYSVSNGDLPPVEYSTDGTTWTTYTSAITLESAGDKVYFRGNNATYRNSSDKNAQFSCSAHCYIYGNIMSLVDAENYATATTLTESYTFYQMFYNNKNIKSRASLDLVLPATTLTESCYYGMFKFCTGITRTPALPASTLAQNCYNQMFRGCDGLTNAPALPATTLADNCYQNMFCACRSLASAPALPATTLTKSCYDCMFYNCNSLTVAPALPATELEKSCYSSMFCACHSLTSAPVLPATTLASSCYHSMFEDCTSLTNAPALPATTLASCCYQYMFRGCTHLTSAPALPATTLASSCYESMFQSCTDLTSGPALPATELAGRCYMDMFFSCTGLTAAPSLPATILADWCYYRMFWGCTSLTVAPVLPATTLTSCCYNQMFEGCTSLTNAPELPATTLASSCYGEMFRECAALTNAPELPATTLAKNCYQEMFYGCASLTTSPELPATTLARDCYRGMFYGCTGLNSAPALPATILEDYCYWEMFYGCTGLSSVPVLPATTLATGCYEHMFQGCTSLTSAPVLPATTIREYCYFNMFSGCTSLSSVTCYANARDNTKNTKDWLNNVAATGTFYGPKNSVFVSQERNADNIPEGWTFIPFQASLITAPTAAEGLVYTGTAQALLNNDGVAEGGTLKYSLDNSTWDAAIPTGTAAGNYTVYYMVQGDETHVDYTPSPNTVAASIAKAPLTIKADDKWLDYGDPLEFLVATYTGFVNGEGPGYVQPAVKFSSDYTQGDNAGTYTITPYGAGAANYEITYQPGILHVNKLYAAITTAPTAIEGLVANGSAQTLINAGEATGGEMQYSLDGWVWGTGLPTATDANTYTVYYRVVGDINHYSTSTASFPVTIAPASASMVITANLDPLHAGVYYSTFYDSSVKYALPAGVEAYVADLNGTDLVLTKIAEAGQVLPTNTAVILKAASASITLTVSDAAPVSFSATNDLLGTDVETNDIPANCYVLSGHSTDNTITGVGFYLYTGTLLKAHRAYAIFGGSGAPPRMMRFVFGQEQVPTGTESVSEAASGSVRKVMVNGQLFIEKDGVRVDVTGKQVR